MRTVHWTGDVETEMFQQIRKKSFVLLYLNSMETAVHLELK